MAMWDYAWSREDKITDPDEWMEPFRDHVSDPPEVNRLVHTLKNRQMIPRLKAVSTSLRRKKNGSREAGEDDARGRDSDFPM